MRTTLVKFVARVCGLGLAAVLLACLSNSAQAQTQTDDPAARAMARIRAKVDERAEAAERALAAAGFVNKGVEARKQGKSDEARAALRQAELMIIASAPAERGLITEELLRRIAAEQAALNPTAPAPGAKRGWPGLTTTRSAPRIALARYNSYRDILTRILIEEKLPLEVLSVALVESGFNPLALSPKGARGIWQLMPDTARRYGLMVAPGEDHRTHPEHATRAAARYLQDLYRMFGDWELALAAYNAGEGRVQRAIERAGAHNFKELARRKLLPLETRNYVPTVLAAWSQMSLAPVANRNEAHAERE
jgi:soluble lytic murein transglycosylase-like protein